MKFYLILLIVKNNDMKAHFFQKVTYFLIIVLISSNTFSQPDVPKDNYLDIIPPSPNMSGLGEFVDIPVNLYTGVPDISIPLYVIKAKGIEIPITLEYHPSGIKVEQISSWVGLGWSLKVGGAITRVVRGIPDDNYFETTSENPCSYGMLYIDETMNQIFSGDLEQVTDGASFSSNGQTDTEPDLFYYFLPNDRGKFVFNSSGQCKLIPICQPNHGSCFENERL